MVTQKLTRTTRSLFGILIFAMVSALLFLGSSYIPIYASPTDVSDAQASADGYEIILYCGQSLLNNYFDPAYPRSYCDQSMVYFNAYCEERAFYPEDHVCTYQDAMDILYNYIKTRGLEGSSSPNYLILEK